MRPSKAKHNKTKAWLTCILHQQIRSGNAPRGIFNPLKGRDVN